MQPGSRPSGRWKFETEAEAAPVRAWWKVVWGPCTATNAIDGMADCAAARAPRQPCAFGAPLHPPEPFEDGAVQLWVKGGCRPQVDGTAGVSSTTELPYASRQLRLVPIPDTRWNRVRIGTTSSRERFLASSFQHLVGPREQ